MGKDKKSQKLKPKMAFAKAYNAILGHKTLKTAEKLVMVEICRYWPNPCWQANSTIAKNLNFSERYIERIVEKLAKQKVIKRGFAHSNKNGRCHTVRIIVPLCFSEKCSQKIKWLPEQSFGHQAEHMDGSSPNSCSQMPEQMADLLDNNKKKINTMPSPLPALGQAQALGNKGKPTRKRYSEILQPKPLSPEEFEKRRQQQLEKLRDKV